MMQVRSQFIAPRFRKPWIRPRPETPHPAGLSRAFYRTWFVDLVNGSDGNTGLSFAQRKLTISSANTASVPGDDIRVMASASPTSLSQNATWTDLSKTVTLTTAVNATVHLCEVAWTASSNVVTTTDAVNFKEGTKSTSIAPAVAFVTGLAAYGASATVDLSGYQQISFWIRTTVAIGAGQYSLRLCSDSVGAVSVNTIAIPAIPNITAWTPITVNTGGALGSNINSVALYVDSDQGAVTILLDNIIACKASNAADCLSLTSLIGKNTATETWWALQSISGTTLSIDGGVNTSGSNSKGYVGTSEAVPIWKLEGINALTSVSNYQATSKAGTDGNPIRMLFGYDTTAMTDLTGSTWIDGRGSSATTGFLLQNSFITVGGSVSIVRFVKNVIIQSTLANITIGTVAHAASSGGANIQWFGCYQTNVTVGFSHSASNSVGIDLSGGAVGGAGHTVTVGQVISCGTGISSNQSGDPNTTIYPTLLKNCNNGCLFLAPYKVVGPCTLSSNSTADVSATGNTSGTTSFFYNCTFSSTTIFNTVNYSNGKICSLNDGQVTGSHKIYMDVGSCQTETAGNRHTASGVAWSLTPTNAIRTKSYPLILKIASIAVVANQQVTVSAWMLRSTSNITFELYCPVQIGITNEVSTSAGGPPTVYEQGTIIFTPTVNGVVDIFVRAFGGTTNKATVDDISVSGGDFLQNLLNMDVAKDGQPFVTGVAMPPIGACTGGRSIGTY